MLAIRAPSAKPFGTRLKMSSIGRRQLGRVPLVLYLASESTRNRYQSEPNLPNSRCILRKVLSEPAWEDNASPAGARCASISTSTRL